MAGFQLTISAVDQASAKIDAINKKMLSMQAPAVALKKSLAKFADISGITGGFTKINQLVKGSFTAISRFAPALGALTAGGIVAGLSNMVKTWSNLGQQILNASVTLGIMPQQLIATQNAIRLLGGSAEDANKLFEGLQDTLRDASLGKNIEAYRLLTAGHVKWRDEFGKPLPVDSVLPQLYDLIHDFKGSETAARHLGAMLNITGSVYAMARMKGSLGVNLAKKAAESHHPLNDDEIIRLANLKTGLSGLQQSVENFTGHLAAKMSPALTKIIERFTAWLDDSKNVDKTFKFISEHIGGITTALGVLFDLWMVRLAFRTFLLPLLRAKLYLTEMEAATKAAALATNSLAAATARVGFSARFMSALALMQTMSKILSLLLLTGPAGGESTPEESDKINKDYLKNRSSPDSGVSGWIRRQLGITPAQQAIPSPQSSFNPSNSDPQSSVNPSVAGNKQAFLATYGAKAAEESARTGVDSRIILAQAGLETGWGAHAPNNNMFGIKGPGGTQQTNEYINGKMVSTNASFRGYANPNASFDGYADFINNNPRYKAMKNAQGMDAQIAALGNSGYATDPDYASKIKAITKGMPAPAPVNGGITVDINHNNAPAGSSVTASSTGGYLGTPKVVQPMSGYS